MSRLLVPVYLNQKLVFDLLAMMQDGISTVTSISTSQHLGEKGEHSVSGGFGLAEALGMLLKVDLSATSKGSKVKGIDESKSEERVHTPASLLYKLRTTLAEKGELWEGDTETIVPGKFIEFSATLQRNPAVEVLDSLGELMTLSQTLVSAQSRSGKSHQSRGKGGKHQQQNKATDIVQKIRTLSENIKAGGTIDLIATQAVDKFTAVIPVEIKYLNDPSMSDLVDGQFNVLSKVIRRIDAEGESISLIRKAAIARMPKANLEKAFGIIDELGELQNFDIPEITWEVPGPAIQVIPIAVYA